MPATTPVPSIADFREAAQKAIRGYRDADISVRTGGGYDLTQGPAAVIWHRQATRDRDLFRQVYTESSTGSDRDRLVETYYKVERTVATYGAGTAVFTRANIGNGAGTIYAGTRIAVLTPGQPPTYYAVAADTAVAAAQFSVSVPMRATRTGSGTATSAVGSSLRLDDSVYDPFLLPTAIVVADGTDREEDDAYLARARQGLREARVGHITRIIKACKDAGAYHVVALHSGTFGPASDFGLNHIYVADANFVTTAALQKACTLALEAVRVAGCDTQVLAMAQSTIVVSATVHLVDDPGTFNTIEIAADVRAAIVDEFRGRTDTWMFRTAALEGAAAGVSDAIQSVDVTTSPTEPAAAFAAVLTRYTLVAGDIGVTFTGPT